MNVFAISAICVVLSNSLMAFILFFKGRNRVSNLWAVFCIFAAIWGVGAFIVATTSSYEKAFLGWQIGYIGGILCPVMYYHFCVVFTESKKKQHVTIFYILAAFFLAVSFLDRRLYFGELSYKFNQLYYFDWTTVKPPLFIVFYLSFYWFLLLYAFYLLVKDFVSAEGNKKNQLKYLILGSGIGWVGAHALILTVLGVVKIYPYANFLIAVYPFFMGYGIVRYQLLNVDVFIKRSLVYSMSVALVTIIFIVLVLVFEKIIRAFVGYQTTYGSVFAAIFIGMIFTPIKNKIEYWIDKVFYKGSQEEIVAQNIRLKEQLTQTERFKMLAHLTGGIATEIKNPLTAIMVYNEYLLERHQDRSFIEKFAKILKDNTERINGLLQQLTDYSNPAAVQLEEANIRKLINQTIAFQRSLFVEKKIDVVTDFKTDEAIHLKIDPKQVGQVFLHVIMNALEAMPNGGTIFITTDIVEGFFRIIIRDTGVGIEEKYKSKIFDPFFSCKQGHTGLGLSISQGIIENHKGKIQFKSQENVGTEVIVSLPVG